MFRSRLYRTKYGSAQTSKVGEGSMMKTVKAGRVGDGMKLEQEVNLRDRRKTDFHLNLCFRRWFHPREIKYGACFKGAPLQKALSVSPSARLFYAKMMLRVWFQKLSLSSFIDFAFFPWLLGPCWLPIYVCHHFPSPTERYGTIRWSWSDMWNHTSSGRTNWKLLIVRSSQRNLPFNWILVGRVPARLRVETGVGKAMALIAFQRFLWQTTSKLDSIHSESLQSARPVVLKLNIICNLIVFHVPLQSPARHSLCFGQIPQFHQRCISFTGNISIFVSARSVRNVNGYISISASVCLFSVPAPNASQLTCSATY